MLDRQDRAFLLRQAAASGFTGLAAQAVWARAVALELGGGSQTHALVLGAYLSGLALGAATLGRRAEAATHPLDDAGRLQLAIAALILLSAPASAALGLLPEGARGAAAFFLVFLPAIAQGAVLPALSAHARRSVGLFQSLYAANAGGAASGAIAASFLLVPSLGLDGALIGVAAVSAAAGYDACRRGPLPAGRKHDNEPLLAPGTGVAAAFAAATAAMAAELVWRRITALAGGSSEHSFAAAAAAVILGGALGALAAGPLSRKLGRDALAAVLAAQAIALPLCLLASSRLPYVFACLRALLPDNVAAFYLFESSKLVAIGLLLLPATAAAGAAVPLAFSAEGERRASLVLASGGAGSLVGAAIALLLLPHAGLDGVIRTAAALCALGAVACALRDGHRRLAALAALSLTTPALCPALDRATLASGAFRVRGMPLSSYRAFREAVFGGRRTLYSKDGLDSTVSVIKDADGYLTLHVNAKADASNASDRSVQRMLAHLPLLLMPDARDVLLIGWGSGMTAGAALNHPVERVDAYEISPEVVEASRFFDDDNGHAATDPRLTLRVEDARNAVARPGRSYDLVLSEPSNPWTAGESNLFTAEFYARAAMRLRPGGLMAQWFHVYDMDPETFALALRTFASAFPSVSVWSLGDGDVLFIGRDRPLRSDVPALERRLKVPAVAASMKGLGLGTAKNVYALLIFGEGQTPLVAGRGALHHDRRPTLERRAAWARFRGEGVQLWPGLVRPR